MTIAVFCASSNDLNPQFHQDAQQLGEYVGKKGFSLVYGGSKNGLMETTAHSAKQAGAHIIGILPEGMRELASEHLDETLLVDSLSERKELLREYADVFVALPGGFGTLDEIFDVLAEAQVGSHSKKLVLLNSMGFYNPLLLQIESIYAEKFSATSNNQALIVVNSVADCIAYLKDNEQ